MSQYQEFSLTGCGPDIFDHHIAKIPSQKFNINNLKQPVTMTRLRKPKAPAAEEPVKTGKPTPFKKKTKAFFVARDEDSQDGEGALDDPDRLPWLLADDEDQQFIGNLEGSQRSNYVLFVSDGAGFKVIPASKWYKFKPKMTYRTLTVEEAEEKMKSDSRAESKGGRWMMRTESSGSSKGKAAPIKSWKLKLLNGESLNEYINT